MRIVLLALSLVAAAPAFAQQCSIEYQRADNMLAAPGRPDGNLGKETLTLQPGQTQVFNTDWKYEKQRNDGRNYYGSHMRIVRNTGQRPVMLTFRGNASDLAKGGLATKVTGDRGTGQLAPGASASNLRADLMEVSCPAADKDARASGPTPGGTPNSAPTPPPTGLAARQVDPTTVQLTWQPATNVKEYRVYVDPPLPGRPPGAPAIVGGNGRSFVIPLPRNAPAASYHASIEAVGQNGSVSQRVGFPPVSAQTAGGPGGSPSAPAASGPAGQQCPAGQFVTGFTSSGALICAAPR
jgi:hypothetical protein